jgi:hypothetical protein
MMINKTRLRSLIKVSFSLICGGIFYTFWLAIFLLTRGLHTPFIETILWFLSPIITALGFANGILIYGKLTHDERSEFRQALIWALTGCAIGALFVYWFGPMLIVFSMLITGTASIALREVIINN